MSQAAAKGIRGASSRKASLIEIFRAFGVVEITFMSGVAGMVIFVSVGFFGVVFAAPPGSAFASLTTLFVGLYALSRSSAPWFSPFVGM